MNEKEMIRDVRIALDRLPKREAFVLRSAMGIQCRVITFREMGEKLGVSTARAHALACKSVERLERIKNRPLLKEWQEG
ncbi:MAG: hypothetical protein GY765_13575 [bacterium]|nr:hypothetical protein [bacterium]